MAINRFTIPPMQPQTAFAALAHIDVSNQRARKVVRQSTRVLQSSPQNATLFDGTTDDKKTMAAFSRRQSR